MASYCDGTVRSSSQAITLETTIIYKQKDSSKIEYVYKKMKNNNKKTKQNNKITLKISRDKPSNEEKIK